MFGGISGHLRSFSHTPVRRGLNASGSRRRYNPHVDSQRADILILSSAIGSGHMRASAALTEGIKLLAPELECLTVDFPREVSPAMEALLRRAYLESLKLMPDVYG